VSIFIGGPLDGYAAGHVTGETHEHKRALGRGDIHRDGVKVHRLDPVEYTASVTDFYRRVEIEGAIHYAHNSLSIEQAKRMMEL
jgi:hypothetical protein